MNDYHIRRKVELLQGNHPLQGRTPQRGDIKVRSNDYLCLADHPHIIESEIAALRSGGHGDAVSRVWVHHEGDVTRGFEQRVAALMQGEDCVVCASGYTANVGLIQAFASKDSPVYLDMKAHISLHEGVISAGARAILFRHNEPQSLDKLLAQHGPGLVAVDALYSTDGDIAPLAELVEVCERHGAALIVDETHSFGAQGPGGAGPRRRRGTFRARPLSHGGAVEGCPPAAAASSSPRAATSNTSATRRWPAIFSTSVMQHEIAGFNAVLDVFQREDWRRDKLHANHAYLRQGLDDLGYNVSALEDADHRSGARRHPPDDEAGATRSKNAACSGRYSFLRRRRRSAASSASR
ncbi:MAG: aminotransferase class I/II-fold pyridoxal phosphate-dependent enzyme [Hyphomicrobium sp.]